MSLVNGKWRTSSSTPTAPKLLELKLKKHVQGATSHAKHGADRNKWVGGADTKFVTVFGSTLFFVFIAPRPGHTADARWLIARVFRQGSPFCRSRSWKVMFRGQNPPKT